MISYLERFILDDWARYCPDLEKPHKLSYILLRGREIRHKVVLFFTDQGRFPILVAKILRKSENLHHLEEEFDNLTKIRDVLSTNLKKTIPEVLSLRKINEDFVLIETALKGKTMHRTMVDGDRFLYKRRIRQNSSTALDWLTCFHRDTMDLESSFSKGNDVDSLSSIVNSFKSAYRTAKNENSFCQRLLEKIDHLKDARVPKVWQHGDFWPLNILVDQKNNVGVVDWEFSRPNDFPFWDLFQFFTSISIYSRKADWGRNWGKGFRYTFLCRNWFSELVSREIYRYCLEFNIDRSLVHLFYPLFLMNMSIREFGATRKHELFDTKWRELLDIYIENEKSTILTFD